MVRFRVSRYSHRLKPQRCSDNLLSCVHGANGWPIVIISNLGARENGELKQGRESFRLRAWMDAYTSLSRADRVAPLAADDLDLLATSASTPIGFEKTISQPFVVALGLVHK
jgi:hypothetical protein